MFSVQLTACKNSCRTLAVISFSRYPPVEKQLDNLTKGLYRSVMKPHKVLTYVEYRAVSDVFRTIDPPPPLHPASVGGGEYTAACRVVRGWDVNISEDARHWTVRKTLSRDLKRS